MLQPNLCQNYIVITNSSILLAISCLIIIVHQCLVDRFLNILQLFLHLRNILVLYQTEQRKYPQILVIIKDLNSCQIAVYQFYQFDDLFLVQINKDRHTWIYELVRLIFSETVDKYFLVLNELFRIKDIELDITQTILNLCSVLLQSLDIDKLLIDLVLGLIDSIEILAINLQKIV